MTKRERITFRAKEILDDNPEGIRIDSQLEDIDRLDSLCIIFGVGLILFDATNPVSPAFQIRARATKHEPDFFYTNRYLKLIADELHL